ncbi:MAG TPA: hypothetical protein VLH40_06520 [Atribacteraceae bacterium]|nr:hypothetical protein [Atribacteraceae bacterium]
MNTKERTRLACLCDARRQVILARVPEKNMTIRDGLPIWGIS